MGYYWDLMTKSFRGDKEDRKAMASSERDKALRSLFGGSISGSISPGKDITSLIESYRDVPALRGVVQRIAEGVAQTRWSVWRAANVRTKKSLLLKSITNAPNYTKDILVKRYEDTELLEVPDDPIIRLLDSGNSMLSGFACRFIMEIHNLLVGESLAIIDYEGAIPVSYWPVSPDWITAVPNTKSNFYKIRVFGTEMKVDPEYVIHMRDPDPANPYSRGAGIGMALGDEIETIEYMAQFAKTFFLNDGSPSAIVAFDGVSSEADFRRLQIEWEGMHGGPHKKHKFKLLSRKPAVTTFPNNFRDIQMTELTKLERDIIRQTFGMPPEIVGLIENSNRATIESAGYIYAMWVLRPRLERWRITWQNQLANKSDERKIVRYDDPVPEDKEYNLRAAQAKPDTLTINEWRYLQGYPPREDGDVYASSGPSYEEPQSAEDEGEENTNKGMLSINTKGKKPKKSKVSEGDVEQVVSAIDSDVFRGNMIWWDKSFHDYAEREAKRIDPDSQYNPTSDAVVEHLREFGDDRMAGIGDATEARIREVMRRGIEDGKSVEEIAQSIQDNFSAMSIERARVIASTEIHRSTQFATQEVYNQLGVTEKEWVSILDSVTRAMHRTMDGQVTKVGGKFTMPDGITTEGPGLCSAPWHDINCRCTTKPVTKEDKSMSLEEAYELRRSVWKRFDSALVPLERRAEKSFRKSFKQLSKQVMAEYERVMGYE